MSDMNCSDFDNYVDDYLEAGGSDSARQLSVHIATCRNCQEKLVNHQRYLASMAGAKAPAIEEERGAGILRMAVAQARKSETRDNRQYTGPGGQRLLLSFLGGAVAASLIAVALVIGTGVLPSTSSPATTADLLAGEAAWQQNLTIVINAPGDMEGARLVFELPADISLRGQEYLSRIDWPITLKKGSNTIVLPVNVATFAEFADRVTLSASLIYKDKKKDFELDLDLAPPQIRSQGAIEKRLPRFAKSLNEFWRLV